MGGQGGDAALGGSSASWERLEVSEDSKKRGEGRTWLPPLSWPGLQPAASVLTDRAKTQTPAPDGGT